LDVQPRAIAQAALPVSVQLRAGGPMIVDPPRFANYQRSDFFSGLLSQEAIAALVAQIERWPGVGGSGHEGGVQLDALGGAVNRPKPSATAFVHRRQRLHCAYLSFWGAGDPPAMAAACEQWTRDIHAAMAPSRSERRSTTTSIPSPPTGSGLLRRQREAAGGGQAPLRRAWAPALRAGVALAQRVASGIVARLPTIADRRKTDH